MSSFDGAVVNEQGVNFAIAIVKKSVLDDPGSRDQAVGQFSAVFEDLPTVLMAQDASGTPSYYGRSDIVDFLASVPMEAIPWQRYTLH